MPGPLGLAIKHRIDVHLDELLRRNTARDRFAQLEADLGSQYGMAAGRVYDLTQIQAQLPRSAALLAWVGGSKDAEPGNPSAERLACLVKPAGDPVWIHLPGSGSGGSWTTDDVRVHETITHCISERKVPHDEALEEVLAKLYELRMKPLETYLQGASDGLPVTHLIVLPSRDMKGIPIEVLTDKYTVSYTPSGTMFAWLREKKRDGDRAVSASLLALGDPAFDGRMRSELKGGPPPITPLGSPPPPLFKRLPGTRVEVESIAALFKEKKVLLDKEATERGLARLAESDELKIYQFIHIATHCVVRKSKDNQILLDPALVLPDGEVTTDKLLRSWRLDASLVTLSACDSGSGMYGPDKGRFAFPETLFLCGARSVVVSMWKVPDLQTVLLMKRFYENILGMRSEPDRRMTKAEALKEAKLWLRSRPVKDMEALRQSLLNSIKGTRGLIVDPENWATG
jgi:CHAT domain-containing protein